MEMQAGQLPCPMAKAAEDSTLIFFDKHDFVDTFTKAQMEDVLELIKAQKLIHDVPAEDLVLRTMHHDKVREMCKTEGCSRLVPYWPLGTLLLPPVKVNRVDSK